MIKFLTRKSSLLIALVMLIGLGIGVTLAYYSLVASVTNEFKTATYDVNIYEYFDNDWSPKKVYISNDLETNPPVLLRVNYNEMWYKEHNDTYTLYSNDPGGTDAITKFWTPTFTNDFVLAPDGWYYYTKVLDPQEKIQILNSVDFDDDVYEAGYEDYIDSGGYNYDLSFNYEAIQANTDAALEIWGKTVTIEGDNVTWS